MLDTNQLRKQFKEILYSFSKEDLELWLKFAEEREQVEMITSGNSLKNMSTKTSISVFVQKVSLQGFSDCDDDTYYAMAA